MADSTQAGYLLPLPLPAPLFDDDWDDFLHDLIAGITGLDPTLVRPRWEPEPVPRPDIGIDWVAFGHTGTEVDFDPAVIHIDDGGDGYDALQTHEVAAILLSFYGPHCDRNASYLQRGIFVDQNRAILRANAVGLVDVGGLTRASELVKERWWPRCDVLVHLRREIRFNYAVKNLLRAKGTITAQPPAPDTERVIVDDFDTGPTRWDGGSTRWDDGDTRWPT
jgi:hypothetical protein